jgi:lipopolysaccharide biosynthesis regulator YciM
MDIHPLYADSVAYYQSRAYMGQQNWSDAIRATYPILIEQQNEELINLSMNMIKSKIFEVQPHLAIELLSYLIDKIENDTIVIELLLIIAEVYEQNQLYNEANDVYQTILKEPSFDDTTSIKLKHATNSIYINQYEVAIRILEPIVEEYNPVYIQEALYLLYLGYHSQQLYEKAQNVLIHLYLNYPEHENKYEITKKLASLYEDQKEYIVSWYLLEELIRQSTPAQRYEIFQQIEALKERFVSETMSTNQFRRMKLILQDPYAHLISPEEPEENEIDQGEIEP